MITTLTMLRGLYCPHKVDLKGTPRQIYNDWYAHLSPATRNRIVFERFNQKSLPFPSPDLGESSINGEIEV